MTPAEVQVGEFLSRFVSKLKPNAWVSSGVRQRPISILVVPEAPMQESISDTVFGDMANPDCLSNFLLEFHSNFNNSDQMNDSTCRAVHAQALFSSTASPSRGYEDSILLTRGDLSCIVSTEVGFEGLKVYKEGFPCLFVETIILST